jgi:AraC-like DNA-binding protein
MLNYAIIAKALRFIEENLDQDISLNQISEESGMSRYHFARTFKSVTGSSFKTYHNRKRIEIAKKLLETRSMRITDVCFEVGFNDLSYFNRVFRRFVGMSPLTYQKQFLPAVSAGALPHLRDPSGSH